MRAWTFALLVACFVILKWSISMGAVTILRCKEGRFILGGSQVKFLEEQLPGRLPF
jgi:hypothetical protein